MQNTTTIYGRFPLTPREIRERRATVKAYRDLVARRKAEAASIPSDAHPARFAQAWNYVREAEEFLAASEADLAEGLAR